MALTKFNKETMTGSRRRKMNCSAESDIVRCKPNSKVIRDVERDWVWDTGELTAAIKEGENYLGKFQGIIPKEDDVLFVFGEGDEQTAYTLDDDFIPVS